VPRKVFVSGEILTASDVNVNLMDQSVMVFDDSAARGSAIPSPSEGMVTYLKDTDQLFKYTTDWVPAGGLVAYKFVQKKDIQSTNLAANATADVTNLSITHTASNSTNRIIVRAFVNVGTSGQRARTALIAYDGTVVTDSIGDAAGSRARVSLSNNGGGTNPERTMSTGQGFAVITPGDTSSHTYNVKILNANSTTVDVHVNRSFDDGDGLNGAGRGMSYIELMEVSV
jgi:hypothetical protein